MTATVERKQFRSQIDRAAQLPDHFLLCRLVGHSWERILPDRTPMFGRLVVWQCHRCDTKRDDIVQSQDGSLLARVYRYPEGYLAKKTGKAKSERGGRRFSTPALRIALLRRDDVVDAEQAVAG